MYKIIGVQSRPYSFTGKDDGVKHEGISNRVFCSFPDVYTLGEASVCLKVAKDCDLEDLKSKIGNDVSFYFDRFGNIIDVI